MRKPLHTRPDGVIEARAQKICQVVETLTGEVIDAARLASELAQPGVLVYHTGRTECLPPTQHGERVGSVERRMAMGNASSEVASYPVLDGAPVGNPESLKALRAIVAHERSLRPPLVRSGHPWSKRAKAAERAAKHQAKQRSK